MKVKVEGEPVADRPRPNRLDGATIADRRKKVAALYLRRQPMDAIAQQLDVSRSTVSLDLKALRQQWQEENREDIDAVITRELAELSEMERDVALRFHEMKESEWITARLRIKERRARLMGLDQPARIDATTGGMTLSGEWTEIRTILLGALLPYPEAREAASRALEAVDVEG